jgi:hypothetical protein
MNKSLVIAAGLCALLAAAAPGGAIAAALYTTTTVITPTGAAQVFDTRSGGVGQFSSGSLFLPVFAVSAPGIVIQGDTGADARALANIGTLGVSTQVGQSLQGGSTQFYRNRLQANSRAQFTLDDLLITPTAGAVAPFVTLTLRLAMSGRVPDPIASGNIYDTATLLNQPDDPFASVTTQLGLSVSLRNQGGTFSGIAQGDARILSSTTNSGTSSSVFLTQGAFIGKNAALQGGFPFIAELVFLGVPVNQLLELSVDLRAESVASVFFPTGGGLWVGSGEVVFDQTLSFATDQVALLPAGFTLNAPSGNVINNVFTPPAPVPLLGGLPLLLSGVVGAGLYRLRRWGRTRTGPPASVARLAAA